MVKFPNMFIDLFSKHLLSVPDAVPGIGDTAVNKTVRNPCVPEAYILVKRERPETNQKITGILAGSVEEKQRGCRNF